MIKFAPLVIFIFLCALLAMGMLRPQEPTHTSPLIGKPFPTIILEEQEVDTFLKGHVMMVNLFASWCVPCTVEQPILMKIHQQNILPILGIAWKNKPLDVAKWLEKHGNPYNHVFHDTHGQSTIKLAITGIPENFIVDKKGIIRYHTRQPISDDILTNKIIPLVKQLEEE